MMKEQSTPEWEEEGELREAFEATSVQPDDQQLARLARYAATVPGAESSSWFSRLAELLVPRYKPALAVGLVAAAAVVAGLWLLNRGGSAEQDQPIVAVNSAVEPDQIKPAGTNSSVPVDGVSSQLEVAVAGFDLDHWPILEANPLAVLDLAPTEMDPLIGLDLLQGPADQVDLDGWETVYDGILEGL